MAYHYSNRNPKGSDPKLILCRNEFVKNLQGDMETMQRSLLELWFLGTKMGKLLDDVSNIKIPECIEILR